MATWILVSDTSRAKLFSAGKREDDWTLLKDFEHPEGRELSKDISPSAPPGRMQQSKGLGARRTSMEPHTWPKEALAERFAELLAHYLEEALGRNAFDAPYWQPHPTFSECCMGHWPSRPPSISRRQSTTIWSCSMPRRFVRGRATPPFRQNRRGTKSNRACSKSPASAASSICVFFSPFPDRPWVTPITLVPSSNHHESLCAIQRRRRHSQSETGSGDCVGAPGVCCSRRRGRRRIGRRQSINRRRRLALKPTATPSLKPAATARSTRSHRHLRDFETTRRLALRHSQSLRPGVGHSAGCSRRGARDCGRARSPD